jgi:hypothetical protein
MTPTFNHRSIRSKWISVVRLKAAADKRIASLGVVKEDDCFLCHPSPALTVDTGDHLSLIAGLGPVVENFCILSSRSHYKSYADALTENPNVIVDLQRARAALEDAIGPVLLTEHGRVPVCRDDGDQHEEHCHHAHCLVFPVRASIAQAAATYYRTGEHFHALEDALRYAASTSEYLLVSETPRSYFILSEPLNAPRQLARTLVAHAVDDLSRADWRQHPNYSESAANAVRLRGIINKTKWEA